MFYTHHVSADRLRSELPPALTAVVGMVVAVVSGVFGISATDWPPPGRGTGERRAGAHGGRRQRGGRGGHCRGGPPSTPPRRLRGVETPEEVAATLRNALQFVNEDKLLPSSNCGMAPFSRDIALAKLSALSAGARIVREELSAAKP